MLIMGSLDECKVGVLYVDEYNPKRTGTYLGDGMWLLCHAEDCWQDYKPYWVQSCKERKVKSGQY